jgi:membrane protease subunit HflK
MHDDHDDSHDHDHAHGDDPGRDPLGGDLPARDEPLDAANQALADALRVSFRILKGLMVIVVVLYFASNVRCIAPHEQALVLHLGRLEPGVHEPGLVAAWPFPLEEIVPLPTKAANAITIDSHNFHRQPNEVGKDLEFIHRGMHSGLDPDLDGALMTADRGLIHVQWKINYKFDDVGRFLSNIASDAGADDRQYDERPAEERSEGRRRITSARNLIRVLVETVGIHVASEMTAEEMIRTRVTDVQDEMKRRINERLLALDAGLVVNQVEMNQPTPPLQVREAFAETQSAENRRVRTIRNAQQEAGRRKQAAAGSAHADLVALLDRLDASPPRSPERAELEAGLDEMLRVGVEGMAGQLIKDAGAYHSRVVGRMQSDVELYRTLVPEYEKNPSMLMSRLWEQARSDIMLNPRISKFYRTSGIKEYRLMVKVDPDMKRQDESIRLQEKPIDTSRLRPQHEYPVGWQYE